MSNLNTNIFSVIDFYNSMANDYDDHYKDETSMMEDKFLQEYLFPYVIGKQVLDIGSGTGWLLDNFPEIEPEQYMGYEPSDAMLRIAEKKHPEYLFGQLDALSISLKEFDRADTVCLIYGVGNHIDLTRFLTKIFCSVKKRNVIIMFVNPKFKSRAGIELKDYSLDFILTQVESRLDRISDLQITGLTHVVKKIPENSITDAYSWIVRFTTCHE